MRCFPNFMVGWCLVLLQPATFLHFWISIVLILFQLLEEISAILLEKIMPLERKICWENNLLSLEAVDLLTLTLQRLRTNWLVHIKTGGFSYIFIFYLFIFIFIRSGKGHQFGGRRFIDVKGTQDWDFFWLRFWNLYYFFVSYVKILRFYQKKILIGPLLGEVWFFRVVLGLRRMKKFFE
jgi:hypothetical protein